MVGALQAPSPWAEPPAHTRDDGSFCDLPISRQLKSQTATVCIVSTGGECLGVCCIVLYAFQCV